MYFFFDGLTMDFKKSCFIYFFLSVGDGSGILQCSSMVLKSFKRIILAFMKVCQSRVYYLRNKVRRIHDI